MRDPVTDLEINCTSQLCMLEACAENNPELKIVYASTRQVYGRPRYLPVDEKHLLQPVDVNGINKMAGEWYHIVYHQVYGDPCDLAPAHQHLRPAPADPAQPAGLHRLVHPAGRARRGDPGLRRRPPEARLQLRGRRGRCVAARGRDRCGRRPGLQPGRRHADLLLDLVTLLLDVAGAAATTLVPFPPERKRIDIGDFYADVTKAETLLGWQPSPVARGLGSDHGLLCRYGEHYR